jgi:anti-sigma factor RsiW
MKVTRDVIYDLLPSYFAGDASDDTRTLVDAYFETDPECARMASRFQSLLAERQRPTASAAAREREAFTCARMAAELPQKTRASALGCGFASLLSFVAAFATWNDRMGLLNPGILLGVCFAGMALLIFALSFRIRPDSWWRGMAGLDDASLAPLSMSRRRRRRL